MANMIEDIDKISFAYTTAPSSDVAFCQISLAVVTRNNYVVYSIGYNIIVYGLCTVCLRDNNVDAQIYFNAKI